MNHLINLFANVIQYRNIRDVNDDRWASDDDPVSKFDLKAIKDINKYIKKNNINFNKENKSEMEIQGFIEGTISDYENTEINWDEDQDLKALEIIVGLFRDDKYLRNSYIQHKDYFKPIFSDNELNKDISESYKEEFDNDAMGLLNNENVDKPPKSQENTQTKELASTIIQLETKLNNAIQTQKMVPDFQREYLQPVIDKIRSEIATIKKVNGIEG